MKTSSRLTRRRVLQMLLASGGVGFARAAISASQSRGHRHQSTRIRLVGLLPHTESARAIGQRYLAAHPDEADARLLERRITAADSGGWIPDAAPDEVLRRWLSARIRRDFGEDRVVIVDGWILSVTEVRLCALTFLSEAEPC